MTLPPEEHVVIVDLDNHITGSAPRSEMRSKNLIHRASYIIVSNKSGEIFVQKRTMSKDIYPGFYDIAAGGVVQDGETYEESAQRELQEELGVSAKLKPLFDNFYSSAQNRVWGRIFSCIHDGPFLLQKEEVDSGQFMKIEDILKSTIQLTPDGEEILTQLLSGTPSSPILAFSNNTSMLRK